MNEPVGAASAPAPKRPKRGAWAFIKEFRETHDLQALDFDEVLDGLRDRSPGRDLRSEPRG